MKKIRYTALCLALVFFVLSFTACKIEKAQSYESFDYFNSYISVKVDKTDDERFNDFILELEDTFDKISRSASTLDGEVKKINDAPNLEETKISKTTYEILLESKECYTLTDGKFNPAIYPLVKIWNFTPDTYLGIDASYSLPNDEEILALKQKLDYTSLVVFENNDEFYAVKNDDIKIDLGGITKGYALKKAISLYKKFEFMDGYISLGASSIVVFGDKKVSVRNPLSTSISDTFIKIDCENETTLSTSGDYERYYYIDGVKYSHIIDPVTGYPADNNILSATVIGDAVKSDAITTALLTMNETNAKEFIKTKLSDYKVFLVVKYENGVRVLTNTDSGYTITNDTFTVVKI